MKPQRSALTVPGSSKKFIEKAKTIKVDQVILDLEDSVSSSEKNNARALVLEALISGGFIAEVAVRINDVKTSYGIDDLNSLIDKAGLPITTLILPKVESPDEVKQVSNLISSTNIKLQLQIESARGLAEVQEIAKSSNYIEALIFGPGDFMASLGSRLSHIGENPAGIDLYTYPLMAILTAARAYGLKAIDGPFSKLNDSEALRKSAIHSATLGYDGKWAIHPDQIDIINEIFTPSQDEFNKADEIVASLSNTSGAGAQLFDGHMIDEATKKMAEATVARGLAAGLKSTRKV